MKWFREKVLQKEVLIGNWLSLGSSVAAEIAGHCGGDWVLIDMEHGFLDNKDLLYQLQSLESTPVAPFVRIPAIGADEIKKPLDFGASGIMVPHVETVDQVAKIVEFAKYPPLGARGSFTRNRGAKYGLDADYSKKANEGLTIAIQIESTLSLENIDDLAHASELIDILFLGPSDLSKQLGIACDLSNPILIDAMKKVSHAAKSTNKTAGIYLNSTKDVKQAIDLGFTFIACGSEMSLMMKGLTALNSELKELIK